MKAMDLKKKKFGQGQSCMIKIQLFDLVVTGHSHLIVIRNILPCSNTDT
jgi:predicted phosphodiesterase